MSFRASAFLCAIFCLVTGVRADEWVKRADVAPPVANLTLVMRWQPGTGLHLKFTKTEPAKPGAAKDAPKEAAKEVSVDLTPAGGHCTLTPASAFAPAVAAGTEFKPAALPAAARETVELTIKFRSEFWTIYLDDRPVALLPAPFAPPLTLAQPAAELPPAAKRGEPYQQKVSDFTFHDDFLVPEGDDNILAAWQKDAGEWVLHSAVDNSIERQTIAPGAAAKPEPARSPNFYSLKGKGDPALITTGFGFYDTYTYEAAVQSEPGEMGMAFYIQENGAYHAFTMRLQEGATQAELRLWRVAGKAKSPPETLAAVGMPLTLAQWVKLKVVIFPERIRCYVDNTKVIDTAIELPPGGKFGLFAKSSTGVRFDDVDVRSNHELDLARLDDLRRYTLEQRGEFFGGRKQFFFFPVARRADHALEIPATSRPQWLIVGSTAHAPHVFSATFEPQSNSYSLGLAAGYTGPDKQQFRFVCERTGKEERFRLDRVMGDVAKTVETYRLPLRRGQGPAASVSLMCDATNGKELRLYRDGELVLVHHLDAPLGGASGLYVGPGTSTDVTAVDYAFVRRDLYRNKFEKNQIFVEDKFMRHWSSPEGDWIDDRAGLLWHKSDFYGRFLVRLPFLPNTQVHLGVEEGKTNGAMVVMSRDGKLLVTDKPDLAANAAPLGSVPSTSLASSDGNTVSEDGSVRWYTIHYEGHWLWLTSGNKLLFKVPVAQPFRGHRLRIAGFTTDDLTFSYVERFSVQDFLFTESLYDWTTNGGSWEVVNRFQCQPRWSNMNGESRDGLAALWAKYQFRGDFCVEMYAGMRMNWYDRPGDLNLTVMNRDTTSSQGYTITCTGWDADHSQLYTRLFRNGTEIARTDKYLVPRARDGLRRLGYNPLIPPGRDVHGAWYYIKFRRVGAKLEYWFDNELAFTTTDKDPLNDGGLGVWTFRNSMVVARVKIGAESIQPRPVTFTPLSLAAANGAAPEAAPKPVTPPVVLKDGQPLGAMAADLWKVDDPVGRATLAWNKSDDGGRYFTVTNALSGGTLHAACSLRPAPAAELAGWRFFLKRTPHGQVNFYYAVGTLDANGVFQPGRTFFHRISGTDWAKGEMHLSGQTTVPPARNTDPGWAGTGTWTPVEVWLSPEALVSIGDGQGICVRAIGFGNLQPSDEIQGLTGNGPGEGYAVRDFTEIRYKAPRLMLKADSPLPPLLVLEEEATGRRLATASGLAELQKAMDAYPDTGLIRARLLAHGSWGVTPNQVAWIKLPPQPSVRCAWSAKEPGTIVLQCAANYPDRRFLAATVAINGTPVPLTSESFDRRVGVVPRLPALAAAKLPILPIAFTAGSTASSFALAWKDAPLAEPPVLLGVEGLTPFLLTFEDRQFPPALQVEAWRMRLPSFDPDQGTYLEIANVGAASRLSSVFVAPLSLAQYPLVQLRYRGGAMAQVSLALKDTFYARFSENHPTALAVRPAVTAKLDGKWHNWLGVVTDAVGSFPLDKTVFDCGSLHLGSAHGADQTGLFSQWDVDDIVFGPAVARKEQLAFTPRYFSFDGVAEVKTAIRPGAETYADLSKEQRAALVWTAAPDGKRIEPEPQGVTSGICHLFIKARDTKGRESAVTDVPFLLDREAPQTSAAFEANADPRYNGTALRVTVASGGGAPLDLSPAVIKWDDTPVAVIPAFSLFLHQSDTDTLLLNWAHIFRRQLNQAANGQTHRLSVANIRDGAGNTAPPVVVPLVLDYSKDKTPPTLLRARFPVNVLWPPPWGEPIESENVGFTVAGAKLTIIRPADQPPFVRVDMAAARADLAHPADREWAPAVYPYIAMRLRRAGIVAAERTRVDLLLECNSGQTWVFPLTHPAQGPDEIALPTPLNWQAGAWQSLTLDLRVQLNQALLKEELARLGAAAKNDAAKVKAATDAAAKRFTQLRITALRFRITDAPVRAHLLDIQDLFVLGPWRPEDKVALIAYDASGLAGLAWGPRGEKGAAVMSMTPAALAADDRSSGWCELRAKDRAGNLSKPILIPVFDTGGAANVGPKNPPPTAEDED